MDFLGFLCTSSRGEGEDDMTILLCGSHADDEVFR